MLHTIPLKLPGRSQQHDIEGMIHSIAILKQLELFDRGELLPEKGKLEVRIQRTPRYPNNKDWRLIQ